MAIRSPRSRPTGARATASVNGPRHADPGPFGPEAPQPVPTVISMPNDPWLTSSFPNRGGAVGVVDVTWLAEPLRHEGVGHRCGPRRAAEPARLRPGPALAVSFC